MWDIEWLLRSAKLTSNQSRTTVREGPRADDLYDLPDSMKADGSDLERFVGPEHELS